MDSFNGYEIVVKNIITKIANYNVRLLKDELNSDKIKTRICFALLRFYKDIEDSKIDAVDAIENAKALLAKLNQLDEQEGIPIEEIERQSIVLPWVSFEECITKEALEVFSKDLDLEVNILHTRTKFDIIKKEIKIKEDKKERVPSELLDKMLTFGLFFFTSIFAMFDNDTNPQKDKNLLLECLRCGRKAMSKTSFKGFFMMFRYFYIKQDLLRIKGQKINNTLFSALYERAYLTNMMRDSFDRCKKLYNISNDFFIEGCLSQTIFDFVQNEENNKRIIKEINEGIFGGNECTENIFLSNIDEHIKEVVLIFKKMMCLMINFINPHNITYTCTLSTPESFCSVFGFLFRLQSCISIILCWYYTTQKADKIKALETFKDLFMLIQYIDFTCNNSGEIFNSSFVKFIDQYFDNILWTSIYFKRNHPEVYSNIDVIINRSINQVHSIDFSIEAEESESNHSQKAPAQRGRKPKSQKRNVEEDEIYEEMSYFDAVPMIKSNGKRDPDVFEITFIIDLMLNNPNYQGLKSSQCTNVLNAFNKSPSLKEFWAKTRKSMIRIKGKLENSFFLAPSHLSIKTYVKNCILKGIIRTFPSDLQAPFPNVKICFCKDYDPNNILLPNNPSNCWEKDFFIIANSAIFTQININHFSSFQNFPYLASIDSKEEGAKAYESLDEKEINIRKELLEFDLFFNPTSFQTCILYGYLTSFSFHRQSEGVFCKGQKAVQKEMNDFDISLNCFSFAVYILVSKLVHKYEISKDYIYDIYTVEVIPKEWCEREEMLDRWTDIDTFSSIYNVFFILFKNINLNFILTNKNKGDMQMNIVQKKLKSLAVMNSICLLSTLEILNVKELSIESVTHIIEVMCLFLQVLHNDKWIRFQMFEGPKKKPKKDLSNASAEELFDEEMRQVEFELVEDVYRRQFNNQTSIKTSDETYVNFDTVFSKAWEIYSQLASQPKVDKDVKAELSPIFFLIAIKNIKQLDQGMSLHKDKITELCNRAYEHFKLKMNPDIIGMDRYSSQILSEIIEIKLRDSISTIFRLKDMVSFTLSESQMNPFDSNYLITEDIFKYEELKFEAKSNPELIQLDESKRKALKEISHYAGIVELYTKKSLALHKNYILGRFYQLLCDIVMEMKIPAYLEFCKNKILFNYSKVILTLDQVQ